MAAVHKRIRAERSRLAPLQSLPAGIFVVLLSLNASGQSAEPVNAVAGSAEPVNAVAGSAAPTSDAPTSAAPTSAAPTSDAPTSTDNHNAAPTSELAERKTPQVSFGAEASVGLLGAGGVFARSLSGGLRGRLHFGHWSVGMLVQSSGWRSVEVPETSQEWHGALNLGIGGDYVFAGGIARTSLYLGPSILLTGAWVDAPGPNAGVFVDLRPLGLRWPLGAARRYPTWVLAFDPLGVAFIMPSTQAIPQLEVQFTTTLGIEVMP